MLFPGQLNATLDVLGKDLSYFFFAAPFFRGFCFLNLEIIRSAALEAGIPYWTIVQSFEVELEGLVVWFPSESALVSRTVQVAPVQVEPGGGR